MLKEYQDGLKNLEKKNYSEARINFIEALNQQPDNIQYLTALANADYKLGATFRAEHLLHAARVFEPDNRKIAEFAKTVERKPNNKKQGTLGISMIVKNEEKDLPEALESVKEIADEIVVVDTGSTDKTKEIAEKYGAKVYETDWTDDYASARNYGLFRNESEWVLYIDADERLAESSQKNIKNIIKKNDDEIGAYICNIISEHNTDYKEKKYEGKYPRLFRNIGFPFVFFFGRIHEQISSHILDIGKKVIKSDIEIIHKGYEISQEQMNEKVKRNLNMLLDHTKQEPDNAIAWYQLGMTFAQMQMNEQAEDILEHALNLEQLYGYMLSNTQLTLANIYMRKNEFEKALEYAHNSLENTVNPIPAMNVVAHALLRLNEIEGSLEVFEQMKNHLNDDSYLIELDFPEDLIDKGIELANKAKKG